MFVFQANCELDASTGTDFNDTSFTKLRPRVLLSVQRSPPRCGPFCLRLSDSAEHVFQKRDLISFALLLADTAKNSIFDMTGAKARQATVTGGAGE